jgi:hypothetical protein
LGQDHFETEPTTDKTEEVQVIEKIDTSSPTIDDKTVLTMITTPTNQCPHENDNDP